MIQMEQMAPPRALSKPKVVYQNIMLDLETLATTTDAAILSIGAVKFNMTGEISDEAFYTKVQLHGQSRYISQDTLAWWMNQGESAKTVLTSDGAIPIYDALHDLREFVDRDDYLLWSNGADFDIPIINHALHALGNQPLVKHWCHRCFRTFKEEYRMVQRPAFEGTQHNALMDARHQARWAIAIHEYKMGVRPSTVSSFVKK
jgi:DNA polymerase III epsilon subunit-like protein